MYTVSTKSFTQKYIVHTSYSMPSQNTTTIDLMDQIVKELHYVN